MPWNVTSKKLLIKLLSKLKFRRYLINADDGDFVIHFTNFQSSKELSESFKARNITVRFNMSSSEITVEM